MTKAIKYHCLGQSQFYKLKSRKRLAALFGFSEAQLQNILRNPLAYCERQIIQKKSNGTVKTRFTQEPRGNLRLIHEKVKKLLSRIEPPDFLFCPVKKRSYVGNALVHVGGKQVRTLDIRDYFNCTTEKKVFWFFNTIMECERDISSILAKLLTIKGVVPTGSPASPILCFFAFHNMWHDINHLIMDNKCVMTVYMDDITISGDIVPEWLIWRVRKEIYKHGLRYHKERSFNKGFAEVTGVVLRDGRAVVPNRQRLRAHKLRIDLKATAVGSDILVKMQRQITGLQAQQRQIETAS